MSSSDADSCLYKRRKQTFELAMIIYVYHTLLLTKDDSTLLKSKEAMNKRFEMKDLVSKKGFLGINITSRAEGTYMTQTSYNLKVLRRFHMTNS